MEMVNECSNLFQCSLKTLPFCTVPVSPKKRYLLQSLVIPDRILVSRYLKSLEFGIIQFRI
jgi:hypothetical protein